MRRRIGPLRAPSVSGAAVPTLETMNRRRYGWNRAALSAIHRAKVRAGRPVTCSTTASTMLYSSSLRVEVKTQSKIDALGRHTLRFHLRACMFGSGFDEPNVTTENLAEDVHLVTQ